MENPLYAKIFKWVSWALLIISVGLAVWAFTRFGGSGEDGAVNTILVWAYVMLGLALIAVLCVGLYVSATTDPKSLVRIGIGLGAAAVLCLVAYFLAWCRRGPVPGRLLPGFRRSGHRLHRCHAAYRIRAQAH